MKILFVCWANVGRSQMAAALYNAMTGTHDATSAGTQVEIPGETLGERQVRRDGTKSIQVMRNEEGIDIAQSPMTQLTPEMLDGSDYIICMAQPEYVPKWLSDHPKYQRWEVDDPGGKGYEPTVVAKNAIKPLVEEFIRQHPTSS